MNTSIAYNLRSRKIAKGCISQIRHQRLRKTAMAEDDGGKKVVTAVVEEDDGGKKVVTAVVEEDDGKKLVTEKTAVAEEDDGQKKPVYLNPFSSSPGKSSSVELEILRDAGNQENLTQDEADYNEELWESWANKALEYYNFKRNAKFRLLGVLTLVQNTLMPKAKAHINFEAKSDDNAFSKLFFAELYVQWNNQLQTDIKGCCILEQVDSGNANARKCPLCSYTRFTIVHPTARDGYRSASGDPFTELESCC